MGEEKKGEELPEVMRTGGFAWRVGGSILIVFGWLAFLILWLFIYAEDYGLLQNIAMILVSIILGVGILAAMWVSWGIRFAKGFRNEDFRIGKPRAANVVNAVAGIGWLLFLVVWLFNYADNYSGYQNLAVFILSLMVLGAICGSVWALKWVRLSRRHETA